MNGTLVLDDLEIGIVVLVVDPNCLAATGTIHVI